MRRFTCPRDGYEFLAEPRPYPTPTHQTAHECRTGDMVVNCPKCGRGYFLQNSGEFESEPGRVLVEERMVPMSDAGTFMAWWHEADEAGRAAALAAVPVPMVVGSPSSPLGNDIDPTQPVYHVPEGVCGFAWVEIRPRTSPFARWLKATGRGRSDDYSKSITIWVGDYGQSMTRKEAYAQAFASVLRQKHGIRAYANSRLD